MRDLKTIKVMAQQLNYILNSKQKRLAIGVFCVILIGSALELFGISAMLPFIQGLVSPEELWKEKYIIFIADLFHIENTMELILALCLGIIGIYIVKNALLALSSYLQSVYKAHLLEQLSVQMLKSYMAQPYSYFVNTNTGVIIRGVTDDVAGVHDIMETLFKFLSECLVVIFIGIYLIYVDWEMAFGIILIGGICLIAITISTKKVVANASKASRAAIEANNNQVIQIIEGIKEIYVTQTRKSFLKQYKDSFAVRVKANISYSFISAIPERLIETFCIAGMLVAVVVRIKLGGSVESFAASLGIFAVAVVRIMPSISRMSGYISSFVYNRLPLEACYNNIKYARQSIWDDSEVDPVDKVKQNQELEDCVELKNVSWKYSENAKLILDGLNLVIPRGNAIGIIGESGAGKSTLSDVMLGLYKPLKGEVSVDGTSIYDIPIKWSHMIGYVPQSVFLLNDTIRNNIIMGRENLGDDRIWKALELANLKEYVMKQPQKLDAIVGERGINISGGQRQRIAIARALYMNPGVLILDEATSALDNETEQAVMEAIDTLHGQKTLIIIAHRLTTLKKCNAIYEIREGKAIEKDKKDIFPEG